jgi:hypothetical protein
MAAERVPFVSRIDTWRVHLLFARVRLTSDENGSHEEHRSRQVLRRTGPREPATGGFPAPSRRRGHGGASTREAPDARHPRGCRHRFSEVRYSDERSRKTPLCRGGRVVCVDCRRSARGFREHLHCPRTRTVVRPGRTARLVHREATGTESIEEGAPLSLPPDVRDTPPRRDVNRDAGRRHEKASGLRSGSIRVLN